MVERSVQTNNVWKNWVIGVLVVVVLVMVFYKPGIRLNPEKGKVADTDSSEAVDDFLSCEKKSLPADYASLTGDSKKLAELAKLNAGIYCCENDINLKTTLNALNEDCCSRYPGATWSPGNLNIGVSGSCTLPSPGWLRIKEDVRQLLDCQKLHRDSYDDSVLSCKKNVCSASLKQGYTNSICVRLASS
ncbi:hypothetical protein FJZ22_02730 [Candidatus Pacearchaeota archaeon]|nr:hypothetical protein [Candidatus Pacearchaeota archaeon]